MKKYKDDATNIITCFEAGRRGGKATLANKGRAYFVEIGKLGAEARRRNRSPEIAKALKRVSINRKWQ